MVNPTGAATGTFTGTLSGIYNYFINNVTTINETGQYTQTTHFSDSDDSVFVVMDGSNIEILTADYRYPYILNTSSYQGSGSSVVISPTDLITFYLVED